MGKRKLDASAPVGKQLQQLRAAVPKLNASLAREVLGVFRAEEKETGKGAGLRRKLAHPIACSALRHVSLEGQDDRKQELCMIFLPDIIQAKVDSCPVYAEGLLQLLQKKGHAVELLLFWDECVPGNVLSPDLRRKSAMTYMAFADFPCLGLDTAWLTLAVARTQDLQAIPEGYTKYMCQVLRAVFEQTRDGFTVTLNGTPLLFFVSGVTFLADADGIRLCTGWKGASGLKCCLHCTNVLSGKHKNVREHVHISCGDSSLWEPLTHETLRAVSSHLLSVPTRTEREKAETLLGWNAFALRDSFLMDTNLTNKVFLRDVLFDPMHCFVSNGIVNQELGLWFQSLVTKTSATLKNFQDYVQTCWKRSSGPWFAMDVLVSGKMWQVEKDFRGDASQTLRALPLAAAFSMEVLADHAEMQKEIASLTALYAVILAWLACKRGDVTQVQTNVLRQKQKEHAEQFVAAYGWQRCRPKLHYSMRIPDQVDRKQRCADAFACERKHRYFKTRIACNVLRISDFCSTALLKCVERDAHASSGCERLDAHLVGKQRPSPELASYLGCDEAVLADGLEVNAVSYLRGQYRLLSTSQAIEILKIACVGSEHLVLCQELEKRNETIPGFSRWCLKSEEVCCVLLKDVVGSALAIYQRTEAKDASRDVAILLG